jgi:LmbE family N-acetylglucosaminyl deacetylase
MFFSTAVQALTAQPKGEFWALCLSNGASPGALLLLPTASDPTQCARASGLTTEPALPSASPPGNADGLGSQRAGELAKSYEVLGVPQSRIILFGHPCDPCPLARENRLATAVLRHELPPCPPSCSELQDDMTAEWNPDVIAETIKQIVDTRNIQNVRPSVPRAITPRFLQRLADQRPTLSLPIALPVRAGHHL